MGDLFLVVMFGIGACAVLWSKHQADKDDRAFHEWLKKKQLEHIKEHLRQVEESKKPQ